jgi:hypothetical protein
MSDSKNYLVQIDYDIARPHRSVASYRVSLVATDESETAMHQIGPVHNDNLCRRGVFTSKKRAVEAILQELDFSVQIVAMVDLGFDVGPQILVQPLFQKNDRRGCVYTLLARKTPAGTYIAEF